MSKRSNRKQVTKPVSGEDKRILEETGVETENLTEEDQKPSKVKTIVKNIAIGVGCAIAGAAAAVGVGAILGRDEDSDPSEDYGYTPELGETLDSLETGEEAGDD